MRYLVIAVLLAVVFVLGIIIGSNNSNDDLLEVQSLLQESELNTESYLIEQEMLGDMTAQSCELAKIRVDDLSAQLYKLGQLLNTEDPRNELGERNYNLLKRKFHLMQIKTYLLFYNLNQNCNMSSHIILYYFKQNDEDSIAQGRVLDRLVAQYDVNVFAVEYNFSSDLNFVESFYNVKRVPSIIIDYAQVYEGITEYADIEDYLSEENI